MGRAYKYGGNIFNDVLVEMLIEGHDISNKNVLKDIKETFKYILENALINPKNVILLNFDIINDNGCYKILGNNAISALWLSGLIIDDVELIQNNNTFIIDGKKYKYNKRKRELTYNIN